MSDYQKNVHVFCLDDKGHAIERYLKKQGLPVPAAYICDEIGFYIAAHEEAGMKFDTECQQIDYGMGLVLLLHELQTQILLERSLFTGIAHPAHHAREGLGREDEEYGVAGHL